MIEVMVSLKTTDRLQNGIVKPLNKATPMRN